MPKVEMSELAFIKRELETLFCRDGNIEKVEYFEEKDNEFLITIWFTKYALSYDQFYLPDSLNSYEIDNFEILETYFGKVRIEVLISKR